MSLCMRHMIRCELLLFVLLLLFGLVDDAQLWWRSYFRGRMEVQIVGCEDIQYAIDHSIPFEILVLPRKECVIAEPLVIGSDIHDITLKDGMFIAAASLGERSIFEIVDKDK